MGAEKVGGNRHPKDAQRKQTAADRRAGELDPSECRETEAGKVKMADRETVQTSVAGGVGVGDAARACGRSPVVVQGASRWKGSGRRSGVWHGICCVELLQAEDRAWAGERVV